MTYHPHDQHDQHDPSRQVIIKDRVVVRDDTKISGATMLGALVAIVLVGGALVYAFSGDRDTAVSANTPAAERSAPDSTTGQGQRARAPKVQ